MKYATCKEIAKEIREAFKPLSGVKVSVTSNVNHIYVQLMEAPFCPTVEPMEKGSISVNQYSFMRSETLSVDAKVFFQLCEDIIKRHHWDESDSMTDYFNCAFYYSYEVGKWDRPFVQTGK